ncbi:MAG TPA: hypothetical protein VKG80_23825 [Trebonia sp.]|nr:hypothetical protein [Trebonia sp.]
MGVVGTLLKNRRAGEANLARNLPGLRGPYWARSPRRCSPVAG